MTKFTFNTVDGEELKIDLDDVRHIEHTTRMGEQVIIIHLRSTGREFILDGASIDTLSKIGVIEQQAHAA